MDQQPSARVPSDVSPVALLRRRLRATLVVDFRSLSLVPQGGWLALLAIAAVVVLFGVLRVGIRDVYTESLPFLLAAMLIGYISRGTGIALVALFAVADLIVPIIDPAPYSDFHDSPTVLVGRLISWWLLWLLVVSIPTLQRQLRAQLGDDPRRPTFLRLLAAPLSAVVAGALTFLWSNAQPYLIRPVFDANPQTPAMLPQQIPVQLAVAAGVMALLLAIAYQSRVKSATDFISLVTLDALPGRAALMARAAVYALALVAILGLLTSPVDLVVLVAAFIVGEVLAAGLERAPGVAAGLARVPLWARLIAGLAATFLVAQVITSLLQEPALGSEFFPMIVSSAVGLVIFRLLVVGEVAPMRLPPVPSRSTSSAVAIVLLAGLGATAVLLSSPTPAAADNCGGMVDCLNGWWAQVGAAVSAVVAFLWSIITAVFEKTPPVISELEPLASDEGATAERAGLDWYREVVLRGLLADTNDFDEYERIKNLSAADFADEARTGKWDQYTPHRGIFGGLFGGGGVMGAGSG